MATDGLSKVFEHLRQTLRLPDEELLTDSELLTRFINRRDQAAFAALFRRHSRMVLTVCRRVLGHAHDAEDSLQATFLVLARKAKSVLKREALGSYLYKVAYRTALEAKTFNDKRNKWEKLVDNMPPMAIPAAEIQDWRDVLYRELNRLPEKYREPIILCDLEGQSRKRVANQLRLPEGTLSSRLAKARAMLGQRLSRRGIVLSPSALATALAQEVAAAPLIPASLVASTTKAALLVAAGKAASIPAVVLMKGVLKAMLLTKLKIAVALLLVMSLLGASGFSYRSGSTLLADPPENEMLKELKALRRDMELLKANMQMVMEKVNTQEAKLNQLENRVGAGPGVVEKRSLVPDGGTVLMGGLKQLSEGRNEFDPPVLSEIPYINRLFKNVGYGKQAELQQLKSRAEAAIQQIKQWEALQAQYTAEIEDLCKKLMDIQSHKVNTGKMTSAEIEVLHRKLMDIENTAQTRLKTLEIERQNERAAAEALREMARSMEGVTKTTLNAQLSALQAQHALQEKALRDNLMGIENTARARLKVWEAERQNERTLAEVQLRCAEKKMQTITQMINRVEREMQEAFKALETAPDNVTKRRAQEVLDKAAQKLRKIMEEIEKSQSMKDAAEHKQQQVKEWMQRFNFLFKDGKYEDAEMCAQMARKLDPDNPVTAAAVDLAKVQRRHVEYQKLMNEK